MSANWIRIESGENGEKGNMRVVRTELFFAGEEIVRSRSLRRLEIADVSFAWINDVYLDPEALGVPAKLVDADDYHSHWITS